MPVVEPTKPVVEQLVPGAKVPLKGRTHRMGRGEEIDSGVPEPIAIIGMSGRFPERAILTSYGRF